MEAGELGALGSGRKHVQRFKSLVVGEWGWRGRTGLKCLNAGTPLSFGILRLGLRTRGISRAVVASI